MALRGNHKKTNYTKSGVAASFTADTNGNVFADDDAYLWVFGWQGPSGAEIGTISDDQGGSWTLIETQLGAGGHRATHWRGTGFSGGAPLTATIPFVDAGTAGSFTAYLVSASDMTAAAVNDSDKIEQTGTTTATTPTITTTAATTLIWALLFPLDLYTMNVPSGWTLLEEQEGTYQPFSLVYREESSTGSFSASWTISSSTNPISIISAFEGGSGSPPPSGLIKGSFSLLGAGI